MCGLSRLLFPAAMVGMGVATIAGSAAAGWLAAAAVAAALYLWGRRRPGGSGACSLTPPRARPFEGLVRDEAPARDEAPVRGEAPGDHPGVPPRPTSGTSRSSR